MMHGKSLSQRLISADSFLQIAFLLVLLTAKVAAQNGDHQIAIDYYSQLRADGGQWQLQRNPGIAGGCRILWRRDRPHGKHPPQNLHADTARSISIRQLRLTKAATSIVRVESNQRRKSSP